mgnify:CR=1 FL=1
MYEALDTLSPKLVSCTVSNPNSAENDSYGERIVQHYELEYILSGSGYILVNGIPVPVVPHTLNLRYPGMCVEGIGIYECIFIEFDLNEEAAKLSELEQFPIVYKGISPDYLSKLFHGFLQYDLMPVYSQKLLFKSQILTLLNEMMDDYSHGYNHVYCVNDIYSDSIKQSISYIQTHYGETVKLESLAAESGYSVYHFCRLFKKITGWTPIQYLTQYRINKSKRLLVTTDKKIETILMDCGFNNYSYFFRTFKLFYGMTPQAYRRKCAPERVGARENS